MNRPANSARVLIVDDDIIIRHYCQRALRRDADVQAAEGVSDALEKLRSMSFDVIVTDEHMPDGSGRALLAEARALQSRCRRVLMSGDDFVVEESGAYERFFPKLGGLSQVVAWVREAVMRPRA